MTILRSCVLLSRAGGGSSMRLTVMRFSARSARSACGIAASFGSGSGAHLGTHSRLGSTLISTQDRLAFEAPSVMILERLRDLYRCTRSLAFVHESVEIYVYPWRVAPGSIPGMQQTPVKHD